MLRQRRMYTAIAPTELLTQLGYVHAVTFEVNPGGGGTTTPPFDRDGDIRKN